ncbi:Reticulon-like protein B1 [Zostera marina]|uniref:Reticulon-like protein n=1 Tax=Zostera marina TaxID=29655 RepID=A0A0K9PBS7_ZOSMR|nr:Reticulon-like protein B1 [Zostera marina]
MDDSSSSDSDNERFVNPTARKKHLFGRTEPLHKVLGNGKSADVILWRNKQLSGSIVGCVTFIWCLFEWLNYHLLTILCYSLMLLLAILFVWSNASSFFKRAPPRFPNSIVSEETFLCIAQRVRYEINEAFITFQYVASGKDLKTFLMVIAGLWILSIIGSWFNFLTLFYIVFVLLYTLPVLYEKYEDYVDRVGEKALVELDKQYQVLDAMILQKIPMVSLMNKKQE